MTAPIDTAVQTPAAPGPPSLYTRLLAEARRVTTQQGWAAVTMQSLADAVGVSRQTVYNELGGKGPLAETLVLDELARFLEIVESSFAQHPDDLFEAIRSAVRAVLEHARDNALLHAVVSATHGADTDLLPLLTTNSQSLLTSAKQVVAKHVEHYDVELDPAELEVALDMVVRVVLSHVMQPSGHPAQTADGIAQIARRLLT